MDSEDTLHSVVAGKTQFVGREDELEFLRHAFDRAVREGTTQLITVVGEPGIGKTRLMTEFRTSLESDGEPFTWRQGRCLPYGRGVVFWALGEIVKSQAGILESDGPEEATRKLAAELDGLDVEASEREWLVTRLGPLVGAEGDPAGPSERAEAATAWRRFLEAVAAQKPLVVVFEDLQWGDDPLLGFIDHLMEWSLGVPVLVLCAARPELYERRPGWGGGKRFSANLALPPLTDEETGHLLETLLSQAALPPDTQAMLIERCGGNPLYAEQFVSMLTDRGILIRQGDAWTIDPHAEIPVPGSARALIAARLGTLGRDRRRVLQDAAVFGRVFWEGGLAAMSGGSREEVREILRELVHKELVRPVRMSSVKDEPQYSFWHLLLRDVAYSEIPSDERASKHRAAAEWIERLAGDRTVDRAEILAHHYREALARSGSAISAEERSELEGRSLRFLVLAGDRVRDLDVDKADDYYREALALRPPDHPEQTEILGKMAATAHLGGHFPQAAALYEKVVDDLTARGREAEAASAMLELAYVRWNQGETSESRKILAQALSRLEQQPPGRELGLAYAQRAADLFLSGQTRASLECCDRALELADRLGLSDVAMRASEIRGMNRCDLGDWGGLDDLRDALRVSEELGWGERTVRAYLNLGTFITPVEGPVEALRLYREGISLAERRGLAYVGTWTRTWALGVMFELGMWDELVATADEVLEWDRARGGSQLHVAALDCKAEVLACRGQLREAIELIKDYLPRARAIGDPQILIPALAVATLTFELAGDPGRAVGWVEEAERQSREGSAWVRTLFLHVSVRAAVAAGRQDLAERLLHGADVATPRGRASVLTSRAATAEAAGHYGEAAGLYAEAGDAWRTYGFDLERARAQLGEARTLLEAQGEATNGRVLDAVGQARATFTGLRAAPLVAEADALLARIPGAASRVGGSSTGA